MQGNRAWQRPCDRRSGGNLSIGSVMARSYSSQLEGAGLAGLLETEFRQLSQDARKSEGLASFFTSSDHPEVKEAAERAVLKIRSMADSPDALEQIKTAHKVRWGAAQLN